MFAKLVTTASATTSANVFYNTLVNIITGTFTSNTQLDPTTFNQSSSYIINVNPTNWTVNDPSANLAGIVSTLPGANAYVISSPHSDNPNAAKYLLLSATSAVNTMFNIVAIPMEGYANTTKVTSNVYPFYQYTGNTYVSTAGGPFRNNQSALDRFAYDLVSPLTSQYTANGIVCIVSASNTHLFVATYKNTIGTLQSGTATAFNNYFYLSEYSRDDPWNTVGNGYPSWFFEGASNTFGAYINASISSITSYNNTHFGAICRILNTGGGNDINWLDMNTGATVTNTSDWGIATRNHIFYATNSPFSMVPNYGYTGQYLNYIPRGLAIAGTTQYNFTHYWGTRDASLNQASPVSELRLVGVNNGAAATSYSGKSLQANNMFAGGSISNVSPYLYATKTGYNSFDEVSFNGNTFMHLILNSGLPGQQNASCILIREV